MFSPKCRADCRRQLPADRFAGIDGRYTVELLSAREEFHRLQQDGRLDHERVATYLRRRLRDTHHTDELVVTARAIEAAALPVGFYIDIDLPLLINAAERNARPGRNTLSEAAALDAYARPAYAATAVMAMCEIPPTRWSDSPSPASLRTGPPSRRQTG